MVHIALPAEFLMELKLRNDIESVVSSYVNLKRAGRNLTGLCPFHNEKTPSFTLYTEDNTFYCFGCQAAGDVITFIRRIENLDYIEAVRFLADRAGMSMPQEQGDDGQAKLRGRILEMNRAAAKFYHMNLTKPEGRIALDYLRNRGLADNTIRKFGLGYAPDSWDALIKHLHSLGYSQGDMIAADLAVRSRNGGAFDRFRHRVMFPIIDLRGGVVGFTGRLLDKDKQKGKYVNTSQTLVFKKNQQIYALNTAKNNNNGTLILCEGNMDVIAMHQAGFTNAVAAMGTAFNADHARILSRYCENIIIAGDNDEAGQKAVEKEIKILRDAGITVKILIIPSGKDADEFLREKGKDGPAIFAKLIQDAVPDMDFKLLKSQSGFNMDTPEGRVEYSKKAVGILCDIDNRLEREIYAAKIASQLGVSKDSILTQVSLQQKRRLKSKERQTFREIQLKTGGYSDKINPDKPKYLRAARAEEQLISILINNPELLNDMTKRSLPGLFITKFNKRLFEEIALSIDNGYTGYDEILTDLNRAFDPEEISAVHAIALLRNPTGMGKGIAGLDEIDDYCEILKQENEKIETASVSDMSIEDAAKAFEKIKNMKLRG